MRLKSNDRRRICFITGSRAEFGLMQSTLKAIVRHPKLTLQIVATGMHLDRRHGRSVDEIRRLGWPIDAVAPWAAGDLGVGAGGAIRGIARILGRLGSEVVLVAGDRAEAFAGAVAGKLCGRVVAHVHGGDRAAGQIDDSLRHAISKLAHVHFAATGQSAARLRRLGEDRWRIHTVGAPGLDGIARQAASFARVRAKVGEIQKRGYALLIVHPVDADESLEFIRADTVLRAVAGAGFEHLVIIYPNNDPGSAGIVRCWEERGAGVGAILCRDLPRPLFLGLLRDAAALVGNSSAGIIEAASFGTPVVDVGPRQKGRQRSAGVIHVGYRQSQIGRALGQIRRRGPRRRGGSGNCYGGNGAGARIANTLASLSVDWRLLHKLIAY